MKYENIKSILNSSMRLKELSYATVKSQFDRVVFLAFFWTSERLISAWTIEEDFIKFYPVKH